MVIKYDSPKSFISYNTMEVVKELLEAKAAVMALTSLPYQKSWAENLQEIELKREVAGTSRIEGADFTESELDEAIAQDSEEENMTRSQLQARAAIKAYRWIGDLDKGVPISLDLVKEIHSKLVTGCDDDHCAPGALRQGGENVIFGRPRHRGVEGGKDCRDALDALIKAVHTEFRDHDPLVQALAFHYHFGAMHPFQDGNGRTARALEGLMLRRADLKDTLFISMSNYYYDEKDRYLEALSAVRKNDFDLTPFLSLGLEGIAKQCKRLLKEVRRHVEKSLFRDVMAQMYNRLMSTRKRALAERQMAILDKLLDLDSSMKFKELYKLVEVQYIKLKAPFQTYIRDLNHLSGLQAISVIQDDKDEILVTIRLEWGTEVTSTSFYHELENMPKAKTRLLYSPKV